MSVRYGGSDFNIAGLTAKTPAKTDLLVMADAASTPANIPKKASIEATLTGVALDAGTDLGAPGATHRILVVNPTGPELEYVPWSTVAAAGGSTSPGPLNHSGWLSGTQYVPRPTLSGYDLTTIYLNPTEAGAISIYNGSSWDNVAFTAPISLSLSGKAVGFYDIFAYSNGGTLTLEFSTVWTDSFRTRANSVSLQNGVPVKDSDKTRRLVGFIFVHSTGKVNQGGPSPGIISVQYMWNAEEPHSWYGKHAGWAVPWHLCMILGENFRDRPVQGLVGQRAGSSKGTSLYGMNNHGWSFRSPWRVLCQEPSRCVVQNPQEWMSDKPASASGTYYDILLNSVSTNNFNMDSEYDPVGDKFYHANQADNDFYKLGISGAGSSAAASSTQYLAHPVYVPTQATMWGHLNNSGVAYSSCQFTPSTDTFGTGIAGTLFQPNGNVYMNSPMICWCPINDRVYSIQNITTGTVKVINPASGGSVVATISPPTANFLGQSYYEGQGIFYIPTLRKVVWLWTRSSSGSSRAIMVSVIEPSTNVIDYTWTQVLAADTADLEFIGKCFYVPGWDLIMVYSPLVGRWLVIDCRLLASNDSGVGGGVVEDRNLIGRDSEWGVSDARYYSGFWWPGDNTWKTFSGTAGTAVRRSQIAAIR